MILFLYGFNSMIHSAVLKQPSLICILISVVYAGVGIFVLLLKG